MNGNKLEIDESTLACLELLKIIQKGLESMSNTFKDILAPFEIVLENKPKARGIDFDVLELINKYPDMEWTPTGVAGFIGGWNPGRTHQENLNTAYLALSRLNADYLIIKIARGTYKSIVGLDG